MKKKLCGRQTEEGGSAAPQRKKRRKRGPQPPPVTQAPLFFHLIKKGSVSFPDPGSLGLPHGRDLHHGLEVDPGELPPFNDAHPDLGRRRKRRGHQGLMSREMAPGHPHLKAEREGRTEKVQRLRRATKSGTKSLGAPLRSAPGIQAGPLPLSLTKNLQHLSHLSDPTVENICS